MTKITRHYLVEKFSKGSSSDGIGGIGGNGGIGGFVDAGGGADN